MSGLEPVIIPMVVGGGLGAAMDRSNPLRGAALGAVGGWAAAPALGAAGSAMAAGQGLGGAATAANYGAALGGAASAEQAAMLAAQTGAFGAEGLAATKAAMGLPGVASGLGGAAGTLSKGAQLAKLGMGMMQGQQPQPRAMGGGGGGAPPPRMGDGGATSFASLSPFSPANQAPQDDPRRRQMMMMAARMPGIIGNNPYG